MTINWQSVIKAGAVGAVLGLVAGFLNLASVLVEAIAILSGLAACCGYLLVPVVSGVLYGYFTPGEETTGQAAAGGAISGFAAGFMFGVISGVSTAVGSLVDGAEFGDVIANSAFSIVSACCGAIVAGTILGAIGGVIWLVIQNQRK